MSSETNYIDNSIALLDVTVCWLNVEGRFGTHLLTLLQIFCLSGKCYQLSEIQYLRREIEMTPPISAEKCMDIWLDFFKQLYVPPYTIYAKAYCK